MPRTISITHIVVSGLRGPNSTLDAYSWDPCSRREALPLLPPGGTITAYHEPVLIEVPDEAELRPSLNSETLLYAWPGAKGGMNVEEALARGVARLVGTDTPLNGGNTDAP